MRRAIAVHTRGHWPDEAAVDTVTLAFLDRHRRRIRLVADTGTPFLLDLARAQHMSDGDGLELDNGSYVRVRAAAEPVIEIAAETTADLLRIAWHIGNRHLPLQALDYWVRVKWHLDRGEFRAYGYFPGIELLPEPPRLLLVSPSLDFHPTTETILSYFAPGVEVERIGLAVEWRKGLHVMFRLSGAQTPQ